MEVNITGFAVIFLRKEIPGTEAKGVKVTDNQQRILDKIKENPYITAEELSEIIGIKARRIQKNIKKLKEKGILKRIGPDKGGYWEITHKAP